MRSGPTLATREKKRYPETDEGGQFSRSAMIDMDSRLRVARGIATNETLASIEVFRTLRRCGHPHGPPPTISDGWGGIEEAMIEVLWYGARLLWSRTTAGQEESRFKLELPANGQAA
jgi:hypothetical protein